MNEWRPRNEIGASPVIAGGPLKRRVGSGDLLIRWSRTS
jgi:hypothetical protein